MWPVNNSGYRFLDFLLFFRRQRIIGCLGIFLFLLPIFHKIGLSL